MEKASNRGEFTKVADVAFKSSEGSVRAFLLSVSLFLHTRIIVNFLATTLLSWIYFNTLTAVRHAGASHCRGMSHFQYFRDGQRVELHILDIYKCYET